MPVLRCYGLFRSMHNQIKYGFYLHYENATSSSLNSSSSAVDRNGCRSACDAEKRLCGCNSMHDSKNPSAISSSQSGLCLSDVAHRMSFMNVIGFSLKPGNVVSNIQSTVSEISMVAHYVNPHTFSYLAFQRSWSTRLMHPHHLLN